MGGDDDSYEIIDYNDIENDQDLKKPDDFASAIVGLFSVFNLKLVFLLFLIFMFVSSDVFINKFLTRFDSVEYKAPNSKGTFIQGLVLVILFMLADLILKIGII